MDKLPPPWPENSDERPAPGPDELRAIVNRAARRRRRMVAGGAVAALVVGALTGYLVSKQSGPTTTVTVGGSASGSSSSSGSLAGRHFQSGAASFGFSSSAGQSDMPAFTHLFTRTANGVTIRSFLTNEPQPTCGFGPPAFRAEVSTAKMVAISAAPGRPADRTKPISAVVVSVAGQQEGDVTTVVTAATGAGVATVRVNFAGGVVDQMIPVQGWVTLAGPTPSLGAASHLTAPVGTLVALDSSGKTVSSTPLSQLAQGGYGPLPGSCGGSVCAFAPTFTAPQATTTSIPGSKAVSTTTVVAHSGSVACRAPACPTAVPMASTTLPSTVVPPTTLKLPVKFSPTTPVSLGSVPPVGTASSGSGIIHAYAYACAVAPIKVTPLTLPAVTVPTHSSGGTAASG
ncbi:MAG: hypothetical protein ACYC1D_02105 [Acidimicrobiales bacterium]